MRQIPQRILMTVDTIGGVWTYALELARALKPSGVEIALASMGAPLSREQRAEVSSLKNVTVFESCYKLEWMDEPWEDVDAAGDWLLQLAKSVQPDVVHLNGYAHGALAWSVPLVVVAHSCVLSWWQAVKGTPAPGRYNEYRSRVVEGLRSADLVVAPTNAMLHAIVENYGPVSNRRVIPNGRDSRAYVSRPKMPLVLSAGRVWDEAKNITRLDAVAAAINWPVEVAGNFRHPDGCERHFSNLRLLGPLSSKELAERMARAAIYVLPARYEPFGLSILEAALCRCALVIGDIPSLHEVWVDAATYVPPDDEQAIRSAIERLTDSPHNCEEMGRRARKRALRFGLEALSSRYLDAYEEVIGAFNARRVCV